MANPETILLIAAGVQQHTPALQRAFDLAARTHAPVHILLLAYDALIERSGSLVHPEVKRLAQQQYLDERREWLDHLVARWTADGLQASAEVLWAPVPHEAILARCRELRPAVVIKDAGHEPTLPRLLFTVPESRLARDTAAPLLLVHGRSSHLPRAVLAAVDTSPTDPSAAALNERIVLEAARQALPEAAALHVVHVFPYLPIDTLPYRTLEQVYAMARAADTDAFQRFAAAQQLPPERRHWREGSPMQRLIELVEQQAIDLLVLGAAHRSALDRLFLGSTSEALIGRVPCDVLLVQPPETRPARVLRPVA
jgi:universal stress protein E